MVTKETHEKILKVFAIILLLLVLANFAVHLLLWEDGWTEILWFCSIGTIILSIGILLRKTFLISTILTVAVPAQALWILDFIMNVVGVQSLGRTAWLFEFSPLVVSFSVILHFLIIPLALYATITYGFNKKSIWSVLVTPFLFLVAPYLLSSFDDNINCVFYSCDTAFNTLEGSAVPTMLGYSLVPGSLAYFGFILVRWLLWYFVTYFVFLFLFQRVFKKVSVV